MVQTEHSQLQLSAVHYDLSSIAPTIDSCIERFIYNYEQVGERRGNQGVTRYSVGEVGATPKLLGSDIITMGKGTPEKSSDDVS